MWLKIFWNSKAVSEEKQHPECSTKIIPFHENKNYGSGTKTQKPKITTLSLSNRALLKLVAKLHPIILNRPISSSSTSSSLELHSSTEAASIHQCAILVLNGDSAQLLFLRRSVPTNQSTQFTFSRRPLLKLYPGGNFANCNNEQTPPTQLVHRRRPVER